MRATPDPTEMTTAYFKRKETIFILILLGLLCAVIIITKFALGINFGVYSNVYMSFGYKEIQEKNGWAVYFDNFTGNIVKTLPLKPEDNDRFLFQVNSASGNFEVKISCGDQTQIIKSPSGLTEISFKKPLKEKITIELLGNGVTQGAFISQWGDITQLSNLSF